MGGGPIPAERRLYWDHPFFLIPVKKERELPPVPLRPAALLGENYFQIALPSADLIFAFHASRIILVTFSGKGT